MKKFAAVGAIPRLRDAAEEAPLPRVETILNVVSEELDVPVGYVDHAGIVSTLPESELGGFQSFADEDSANMALENGEIESYYLC